MTLTHSHELILILMLKLLTVADCLNCLCDQHAVLDGPTWTPHRTLSTSRSLLGSVSFTSGPSAAPLLVPPSATSCLFEPGFSAAAALALGWKKCSIFIV